MKNLTIEHARTGCSPCKLSSNVSVGPSALIYLVWQRYHRCFIISPYFLSIPQINTPPTRLLHLLPSLSLSPCVCVRSCVCSRLSAYWAQTGIFVDSIFDQRSRENGLPGPIFCLKSWSSCESGWTTPFRRTSRVSTPRLNLVLTYGTLILPLTFAIVSIRTMMRHPIIPEFERVRSRMPMEFTTINRPDRRNNARHSSSKCTAGNEYALH